MQQSVGSGWSPGPQRSMAVCHKRGERAQSGTCGRAGPRNAKVGGAGLPAPRERARSRPGPRWPQDRAGRTECGPATYAPLHRPDRWDAAQPKDIALAYQTAKSVERRRPRGRPSRAADRRGGRSRYGVDLAAQETDPSATPLTRPSWPAPTPAAGAGQEDTLERAQLLAEADAVDRLAEAQQATQEPDERPVTLLMAPKPGAAVAGLGMTYCPCR